VENILADGNQKGPQRVLHCLLFFVRTSISSLGHYFLLSQAPQPSRPQSSSLRILSSSSCVVPSGMKEEQLGHVKTQDLPCLQPVVLEHLHLSTPGFLCRMGSHIKASKIPILRVCHDLHSSIFNVSLSPSSCSKQTQCQDINTSVLQPGSAKMMTKAWQGLNKYLLID
jgi:hypothetical protein